MAQLLWKKYTNDNTYVDTEEQCSTFYIFYRIVLQYADNYHFIQINVFKRDLFCVNYKYFSPLRKETIASYHAAHRILVFRTHIRYMHNLNLDIFYVKESCFDSRRFVQIFQTPTVARTWAKVSLCNPAHILMHATPPGTGSLSSRHLRALRPNSNVCIMN